jgi:hypothetical protein
MQIYKLEANNQIIKFNPPLNIKIDKNKERISLECSKNGEHLLTIFGQTFDEVMEKLRQAIFKKFKK